MTVTTSGSERHYFVLHYHVVKCTNRGGSLQLFLVKCIGSELHYKWPIVFTTYSNVITTHAHINERVAAAAEI